MRTVYACGFEVTVAGGETPPHAFERLWEMTTRWVSDLYKSEHNKEFKIETSRREVAPIPGHVIQAHRESLNVCELISLEWRYPDRADDSVLRRLSMQLARNGKKMEVALQVRLASLQPILKPLEYKVVRPALIDRILESFPCFIGTQRLPTHHTVLDRLDVPNFVEETLIAPQRWLPVVLISPQQGEQDYLVDPAEMQKSLLGHAQVVALRDLAAGYQFTDAVGRKELSCYLGAVRLYWPGFAKSSPPEDHPLYMGDSIRWHAENRQPLSKHLFRMLVGVSGFRFSQSSLVRLVRETIDQDKQQRVQQMLANLQSSDETNEILKELERAWEENDQLKQEREQVRVQMAELSEKMETLQQAQTNEVRRPPPTPRATPRQIEQRSSAFVTVAEAVRKAKGDFEATVVFLDSAVESAKDSPYQWPQRVFDALKALHELTQTWQQYGKLGVDWHTALDARGFDSSAFISVTAKGKFGKDYTFTYEGASHLFENHITLGAKSADTCISIHWIRDEQNRKIVVGWCGRHLRNTMS